MAKKPKIKSVTPPAAAAMASSPAAARASVRRRMWLGLFAALAAACVAAWLKWQPAAPPAGPAPRAGHPAAAEFVGSQSCAGCHQAEHAAWQGSQHARAMQHATADTVLGDFDDARFSFQGVTSSFFQRDGRFFVRTDGPDGRLADFEVKYTFGVEPLQQYLVELPGGRLQALSLSWDTRPKTGGGQRWFRQYPDEKIDVHDELHWTRRSQNWNFMCADCHSTNIRKGYDAAKDAFDTRWSEISVGCEACHGPGTAHVTWSATRSTPDAAKGLTVSVDERRGVHWAIDPTGNAKRSVPRQTDREIQVCAPCHARRAQFAEGYRAGRPFFDHYLPATLAEGLYYPDGQQRDEVFIWGSFRQSKMHQTGVTCGDCHEPHSQKLRAEGNAVCSQCHAAPRYDTPSHHFHTAGSSGAACVNCHMPATTYMVVDPRRDHGFRVPRPDLSTALQTPNACTGCHSDKPASWATAAVAARYGPRRRQEPHFGQALAAGQRAQPGAAAGLLALVTDPARPAIVRATAVELLAQYPSQAADAAIRNALGDSDPQVRHAAVSAQRSAPPQRLAVVLGPLLSDPMRAVRIEAARVIAGASVHPSPAHAAKFDQALKELEAAEHENLDRPEAWLNLGNLFGWRGDAARAEETLRQALRRDPLFVPAYANLADLYRAAQRETDAEQVLRDGLSAAPNAPTLREALGLTLVRQGKKRAALNEFAAAYRVAPDQPRLAYVYAAALADTGRRREAIRVLADSARRAGTRDVLLALASFRREDGDETGAVEALRALAAVNPGDPVLAATRMER